MFVLAGLLVYAVGTHTGGQRRHPSAALAWVLIIALLPYVGLPLFLVLGTRKFARPSHAVQGVGPALRPYDDGLQACAIATLAGMGLAPAAASRQVHFHADGQAAWEGLAALISSAREQLDICTFVLGNDALGRRVARLLAERAAAGVRVRLLLDAVGSWRTSKAQVRHLRAAGVQVHWFMPLLHNPLRGRVNLRNHRKLAIADGRHLWTGGRNLAAEYFSGEPHQPPWIDLSFTLEGVLAEQAQGLFNSHWHHSRGPKGDDDNSSPETQARPEQAQPAADRTQPHLAQLVPSGPDQAEDTFYELLLTTLFRAERRVLAVTPYFVPDDSLLTALCLAARRGVQVELIVPARSNHRLADIARARALRDLVAAGGQVRLAPGMVHAKAVVVDDALALCGSLNLDARSLFLNFELMVAFYASDDVNTVTQWIDGHFHDLPLHRPAQPSLLRDTAEGLVRWLGFQI
ncbi:phospholipase D-like domain-containing protein [Polaromonas sp. UC242_47]|uniref:phospholipase D-like domain-containing protein n=1 Tax=Polaromonas sp. UC242_47 TaxID=3374626 RepID=UPI003787CEA7